MNDFPDEIHIHAAKGISLAEVNRIKNGKRWKHVA